MRKRVLITLCLGTIGVAMLAAQEKLDYPTLEKIRDEGLARSQVMDHVGWLSDVFGPRLTGSPGIKRIRP